MSSEIRIGNTNITEENMLMFFIQNLEALCRHSRRCMQHSFVPVWLHLEANDCTIGNYKKSFQKDLKWHAGEDVEISHL